MTFSMIQFQDDLANKMLGMVSFQRHFANDARSRAGFSKQGRRRVKRAAISSLVARGYKESFARKIVQDAQDYACLLYRAD